MQPWNGAHFSICFMRKIEDLAKHRDNMRKLRAAKKFRIQAMQSTERDLCSILQNVINRKKRDERLRICYSELVCVTKELEEEAEDLRASIEAYKKMFRIFESTKQELQIWQVV